MTFELWIIQSLFSQHIASVQSSVLQSLQKKPQDKTL